VLFRSLAHISKRVYHKTGSTLSQQADPLKRDSFTMAIGTRARSLPQKRLGTQREALLDETDVADIQRLIASVRKDSGKSANVQASTVNRGSNASRKSSNQPSGSGSPSKLSTQEKGSKDSILQRSPRSLTVRQSDSTWSMSELERFLKDDSPLKVVIISQKSQGNSSFCIPVSLMIQRELEMREAAASFGISCDRWKDSLLYREWQYKMDDDASSRPTLPLDTRQRGGKQTLRLDPEQDCAASNHSQSFIWHPWLTTCIRAYYNTEAIRIPDDCNGSDILLALEYFGIVYTPEQLTFDSFGAYLRVKLWSDYFTHRSKMGDWVMQKLLKSNSRHSHSFATSPDPREGALMVCNKRVDILDGGLVLDAAKYDEEMPSCRVVHDFFNDEEQLDDDPARLDALMRDDFRAYVQHLLPGTDVSFKLRHVSVEMARSDIIAQRAVLHVDFVSKPQPPVNMALVHGETPSVAAPRKTIFSSTLNRKAKTVAVSPGKDQQSRGRDAVMTPPSADHVHYDLAGHSSTLSPSDEVRVWKPNSLIMRLPSNTPSDEWFNTTTRHFRDESTLVNEQPKAARTFSPVGTTSGEYQLNHCAPIQNIDMYDDYRTVASGLTGPWLEDEQYQSSSLIPNLSGMKYQTSLVGRDTPEPPPKIKSASQQPQTCGSPERNATLLNFISVREEFMTPVDSPSHSVPKLPDQPTASDRAIGCCLEMHKQETAGWVERYPDFECGSDFVTKMCSYFTVKKNIVERDSMFDETETVPSEKCIYFVGQPEQLGSNSAISKVEIFLPEYDLQSENHGERQQGKDDVTLEDMTATWLRNAFSFKQYSCNGLANTDQACDSIQLLCPINGTKSTTSPKLELIQPSEQGKNSPSERCLSGPIVTQSSPVRVMDLTEVEGHKYVEVSEMGVSSIPDAAEFCTQEVRSYSTADSTDISLMLLTELQIECSPPSSPHRGLPPKFPHRLEAATDDPEGARAGSEAGNNHNSLNVEASKIDSKPPMPRTPPHQTAARIERSIPPIAWQSSGHSDSTVPVDNLVLSKTEILSKASMMSKLSTASQENKDSPEKKRGLRSFFRRHSGK